MGNTTSSASTSNPKNVQNNSQQLAQRRDQLLHLLKQSCADDQFPLNVFRQSSDTSSMDQILDVTSFLQKTEQLTSLLVKLIWNNQTSLSRDAVTQLFRDCCTFDLKQTSTGDFNVLDTDCFVALTNSITSTNQIEQEQFRQWVRLQFPTLFDGVEIWLRKNGSTQNPSREASASNRSLIELYNILNPTWIWLLTHQLPMLYLSADNTCINLHERMASIMYGRMWDHLYDSHRDGASLNRFQHHIFGYKAPLIMLFEISDGYLFCLCCDGEFRESPKHFGGVQSCLFQLKPVFKLVLEGSNIIFMNTKLRGVSSLGLFIGRDLTHTFLSIDGDFFNASHIHGEGRLAAIDVWGAGGQKSTEEQSTMRAWEAKQVEKSRNAKGNYAEEEAILNMAGIETRRAQEH